MHAILFLLGIVVLHVITGIAIISHVPLSYSPIIRIQLMLVYKLFSAKPNLSSEP